MRKTLIYPYGKESKFFLDYCDGLKDIEPVGVIKLRGWDDGKPIYIRNNQEIPSFSDWEEALKCLDVDLVLFTGFQKPLEIDKFYLPFLKMCISNNKSIMATDSIKNSIKKSMDVGFENDELQKINNDKTICLDGIVQINTPIIYIASLIDGLDTFQLELSMRELLIKNGVDVVQVGTEQISQFFGFYDMPSFMFSSSVSEKEKVIRFNDFLKKKEVEEKPDLIIVGIPGELYASTPKYVANFGLIAQEMFFAAVPDALIVTIPYDSYSKDDIRMLNSNIKGRFGISVDAFNISNKRFLIYETEMSQKPQYLTVLENEMEKSISDKNTPYLVSYSGEVNNIVDGILEKFIRNGKLKSV